MMNALFKFIPHMLDGLRYRDCGGADFCHVTHVSGCFIVFESSHRHQGASSVLLGGLDPPQCFCKPTAGRSLYTECITVTDCM